MKIYEWKKGMSTEETKDIGYWERNILALLIAHEQIEARKAAGPYEYAYPEAGWYYDTDNNWNGWKRAISLYDGAMTFHIPDEFDTGSLPEIKPNWDGHTIREKWERIMRQLGCKID